jgi:hypothetical protein
MADPVTSITINFHTDGNSQNNSDYDKDWDTVITATLLYPSGQPITGFKGYGGGSDGKGGSSNSTISYYAAGSDHSVSLSVPGGLSSSDFSGGITVFLRIDTNGNDTWIFQSSLTVTFQTNPSLTLKPSQGSIKLTESSATWQGQFS